MHDAHEHDAPAETTPTLPESEAFRGLHRLPLPTWRRPFADYYVALLERSPTYAGLSARLAALAAAERQLGAGEVQRCFEVVHAFFARASASFAALKELAEGAPVDKREVNELGRHRGEALLQIDIREANYQVLTRASAGGLPPTWAELCASLGVPAWFAESKVKRQQILGLFDPKLQVRAQRRWTATIVQAAVDAGMTPVFVSHDEVIARGPGPIRALPLPRDAPRVRQRVLLEAPIDDGLLRTVTPLPDGAPERALFGVPRHLFFRRFREAVLGEPATILEDLFTFEGALCLRLDDPRLDELAALAGRERAPSGTR
ncbi:MAG: hypothetical protein R3B09_22995 [Nannocystaceae bacterium]